MQSSLIDRGYVRDTLRLCSRAVRHR